jgi:hypothetical protein
MVRKLRVLLAMRFSQVWRISSIIDSVRMRR